MIRILSLSVLALVAFAAPAQADFIIDNFKVTDDVNVGGSSVIHNHPRGAISAEATSTGTAVGSAIDGFGYIVTGASLGDTFTLAYTWPGVFGGNISSVLNNEIVAIPTGFSSFGWTTTVDTGSGASTYTTGDVIAMDAATQLTFSFTSLGGPLGATGSFGGAALVATPEPTALMMLGSVAGFGLIRRRRR